MHSLGQGVFHAFGASAVELYATRPVQASCTGQSKRSVAIAWPLKRKSRLGADPAGSMATPQLLEIAS